MVIRVVEHPGECLLVAQKEPFLIVAQRIPCLNALIRRSQVGICGDNPHGLLLCQALLPDLVPTLVESALIFLDIRFWRVMGCMGCPETHVEEEWFLRNRRVLVANITDRSVDDVLGKMVSFFRRSRRINGFIAAEQLGTELMGLSL